MPKEMKLIMENWNQFASEDQSTLPPEQLEALKQFAKEVLIVTQALEDTAPSSEGRHGSKRRRQSINRIERTKEIKNRANLAGVKLDDFTSAQRLLYRTAKAELAQEEDDHQNQMIYQIEHGDLLSLPLIKNIVDARGGFLRRILSSMTMNYSCAQQQKISLSCLLDVVSGEAQGK